jgi:hypothetical protein
LPSGRKLVSIYWVYVIAIFFCMFMFIFIFEQKLNNT